MTVTEVKEFVTFTPIRVHTTDPEVLDGRGVMVVDEPGMPSAVLVLDQPAHLQLRFVPINEIERIEWGSNQGDHA